MRLLHVSAYYAPAFVYGGPPRSIHGLCRALCNVGADLRVFTTDANGRGRLPKDVTSPGEYDDVPVTYFPRSYPRQPIGSAELVESLRATLRSVDVLHIHGLWNRVVWAAAREARRAGVPYVLSPRGMLQAGSLAHHRWRKRAAYALIEHRTIGGAALLHSTSDDETVGIASWINGQRIVTIPNGVNASRPRPAVDQASLGAPSNVPIILFIGRLHPIKRLDLLIDAFVLLKERRPDAQLVVAGPDEYDLRPALVARAGRYADAIQWTGAVDEDARDGLLHHATALVLCSDSESFGMTVPEAMSAGLPVVVTTTCGWSDVAQHGAGLRVEQGAEPIAGALLSLLESPDSARAMGARGRALVADKYQWDVIARTFLQEYATLS